MTTALQALLVLPVLIGSLFSLVSVPAALLWLRKGGRATAPAYTPPVTVLKPLYGLDKNLHRNLRKICRQDYPQYEVVLSVQRLDDPAIPVMKAIAQEFGAERVQLCIADRPPELNGKIENLSQAYKFARYGVLAISDSDIAAAPDYLRKLVAPLSDPKVGCASMIYRAVDAQCWHEKIEALSFNADLAPAIVMAVLLHAADFSIGGSVAMRRDVLERIGGFPSLETYMVEDAEMGRRVTAAGLRALILPFFADAEIDLPDFANWWRHQTYWDQNERYVHFFGFLTLLLFKAVPFALLFGLVRGADALSLWLLAGVLFIRLSTAAVFLAYGMRDYRGLQSLWLLPLRDVLSVGTWFAALIRKNFVRRGITFAVTPDGKIIGQT
jgi:ceramide glucosyltransferase